MEMRFSAGAHRMSAVMKLVCTRALCRDPYCDRAHACEFCASLEHSSEECPAPFSCEMCGDRCVGLTPVEDSDPSVGYSAMVDVCEECKQRISTRRSE